MTRVRSRLCVALLLALVASTAAERAGAPAAPPPESAASGLPAALIGAARPAVARVPARLPSLRPRPAKPVRILIVGSGVDIGVLPDALRDTITIRSGGGDALGYGTYAATALLQTLQSVQITSWQVYDGEQFNPDRQRAAFDWAIRNAGSIDAVLYAVRGADFVDPATLLLSTPAYKRESAWSALLTATGDHPVGTAFGAARSPAARAAQLDRASGPDAAALRTWSAAVDRWEGARSQIAALAAKGLPVIASAGDLGPNIQTIFGIANLAEVVAVGAFDGRGVAATSSSGPSIDGRAKPDLVATASLVGVLPSESHLAKALTLDKTLRPDWFVDAAPRSDARVRTASTIPAAAVVAAQAATLVSGGIRDVRVIRGALVQASVPLAGVPVWRQGAGVLGAPLTAKDVIARGVPLSSSADLGLEPERGTWASRVAFWHTRPLGSAARLTGFAGVGLDGRGTTRATDDGGIVTASVSNDGVTYSTGMGDRYEAGIYCGYATVSLPRTSHDARPHVSGDGLPPGVREHLPLCLINGKRLDLFGFYIHDDPAENLTFALLPDLPERETVMSGFPKHLPVDPFAERLFQKVTGADGMAHLSNVPPGFFRFRLFSDYGSPVAQTVTAADGSARTIHEELGHNPSYQDVTAFLLSATGVTEADLKARFGEANVVKEKPTGAYLITIAGKQIRVVLNFFKKMPGTAVTSRYIDLIERDDFDYGLIPAPNALARLDDPATASVWPLAADGWLFEGVNAPAASKPSDTASLVAHYNGARASSDPRLGHLLGVAQYPFSLTQPNYKTRFTLSFGYELQNAAIVALVKIGNETEQAVLADAGVARFDSTGPAGLPQIEAFPSGTTGATSFGFEISSRNEPGGTLTLLLVPSAVVTKEALPLAKAVMTDISLRISTWQRIDWPATMTPQGMGHAFEVHPNVSTTQMSHPGCRAKTVRGLSYDECEDWQLMVHSPGEDAATTAVRRNGTDESDRLRSAGATAFDPRRGVAEFSSALTHGFTLEQIEARVNLSNAFRTNGRFWESLTVPWAYLKSHPGTLRFEITDNVRGRDSTLFPHAPGGARVAPFIPYDEDRSVRAATMIADDLKPSILR